jgi:spermidine/putrescine transport system permease protein
MIRFGVTPEINAMASIVMAVSFALVLLAQRLNHGRIPGAQ